MRMSNELLERVCVAIVQNGGYEADAAKILAGVASKQRIRAAFTMSGDIKKASAELKARKYEAIRDALNGSLFRLQLGLIVQRDEKIEEELNFHVIAITAFVESYIQEHGIKITDDPFDRFKIIGLHNYVDSIQVNVKGEMKHVVDLAKRIVKQQLSEEFSR